MKMFAHPGSAQVLVHGGLVVLDCVGEEESSELWKLAEPLRARFQLLEHRKKPWTTIGEQRVVPQARFRQRGTQSVAQLLQGQARDVLLVEPVEFLGVEDSV